MGWVDGLIGEEETTHTVLDLKDVVVDGVEFLVECLGTGALESGRVQAREIKSSRGLGFGQVETEGKHEDFTPVSYTHLTLPTNREV